ncbi:MAG: hypothetical protein K8T10_15600 [Candidatus Eremiobacteraeota bacterium]|nr:hypothetical protein [Candidatus Eremiobacteraeota bacterium]
MSKKAIRIILFTALIIFSTFILLYAAPMDSGSLALFNQAGGNADTGSLRQAAKAVCNPYVSTTLLILGILGLLVELITFSSLAGGIGVIAMSVFFTGHIIMNPSMWWVAIIFGVGIIFLVTEIFFIPGHGITGILGLIASFAAVFIALAIANPVTAGYSILASLLVSGGIFAVLLKYLPKSPHWNKLRHTKRETKEEGYTSQDERIDLEGAMGVAYTDLRPAGIAMINEEKVDVTTDGSYIKKDSPIRVIKVKGFRIVVEEVEGGW